MPVPCAAFCTSDEFTAPNDASLCSSRGSLIWYNSVSRTASHTQTSQGVLQAGDHVKSKQIPIKISSSGGRLLWAQSIPHAGLTILLPTPSPRQVPGTGLPFLLPARAPLPPQGVPLSLTHPRGWDGKSPSSQERLSRTTRPSGTPRGLLCPGTPSPAGDGCCCREVPSQHLGGGAGAQAGLSLPALSVKPRSCPRAGAFSTTTLAKRQVETTVSSDRTWVRVWS